MWELDRDRIWYFAWGCVPVAIAVNLIVGFRAERAALLSQQASADARSRQWQRSAERFERAATFDADSALLAYNAAAAYLQAGELTRAIEWNREALARDPNLEQALRAQPMLDGLSARRLP